MAIIVLSSHSAHFPPSFRPRNTQRKCSRCKPRANYARHPALSLAFALLHYKGNFYCTFVCIFHPEHYKILGMARERQAHSLRYRSLSHTTQKTLLMNGKRHGDSGAVLTEVRNSFAELQIEIACKFVQDIRFALSSWETMQRHSEASTRVLLSACIIASEALLMQVRRCCLGSQLYDCIFMASH